MLQAGEVYNLVRPPIPQHNPRLASTKACSQACSQGKQHQACYLLIKVNIGSGAGFQGLILLFLTCY